MITALVVGDEVVEVVAGEEGDGQMDGVQRAENRWGQSEREVEDRRRHRHGGDGAVADLDTVRPADGTGRDVRRADRGQGPCGLDGGQRGREKLAVGVCVEIV
nr:MULTISPECIES: hypothetical protein [unclassified Frankia]